MLLNPEIQLKAQQQIDEVCAGRLPDFSDRQQLPYIEALVMESLRWHPVVPLCTCLYILSNLSAGQPRRCRTPIHGR